MKIISRLLVGTLATALFATAGAQGTWHALWALTLGRMFEGDR